MATIIAEKEQEFPDSTQKAKKKSKVIKEEQDIVVPQVLSQEVVDNEVKRYKKHGFIVLRNVFIEEMVHLLLKGSDQVFSGNNGWRLPRRAQTTRYRWQGAEFILESCVELGGGPCAIRCKGRYDYKLPDFLHGHINRALDEKGVTQLLHTLCPHPEAKIRTYNLMLSAPGSERQIIHTDSNWDYVKKKTAAPFYITVLIPLTKQDSETGGTRVWPGTHIEKNIISTPKEGYIDMLDPILQVGDALIFDGLLSHCGTENVSKKTNRFFFYLAFSIFHDRNTELTADSS